MILLQTHNKINGALLRHFRKQMNKETKLRIHNITAKVALKFGSEAWVLKKREERRLEAAQMKFFETLTWNNKTRLSKESMYQAKNGSREHSKGNKTLPEKVATCTEDGHKQNTKTSTTISTKRTKEHRKTEEDMQGPTSS